ncbi:MAG: hypothetical protein AB8E82_09060 [Aureispira sp.]
MDQLNKEESRIKRQAMREKINEQLEEIDSFIEITSIKELEECLQICRENIMLIKEEAHEEGPIEPMESMEIALVEQKIYALNQEIHEDSSQDLDEAENILTKDNYDKLVQNMKKLSAKLQKIIDDLDLENLF